MSTTTAQDVNKNFIVFLQLVDIAVSAHSRGDSTIRDCALEELQDIIKSYRLKTVLNVLGNHM